LRRPISITKVKPKNIESKPYSNFQLADVVLVDLRKERFPSKRKSRLMPRMPRADGPFEMLKKIKDNAHKVYLLGEYGVSCMFNVVDLKPYFGDEHLENLRTNSLQQG